MFRIKEEKVEKIFMPVPIAVKPLLTKVSKMHHVLFAISKVNAIDLVNIDEKWFFISEKQLQCFIAADKIPP
jgi:hypothetical protein